jgi:hypothetical protein
VRQREDGDELDEVAIEKAQKGQGVGTIDNSKDEDYSRDTNDERDEEDEDFRPAKRKSCIQCL